MKRILILTTFTLYLLNAYAQTTHAAFPQSQLDSVSRQVYSKLSAGVVKTQPKNSGSLSNARSVLPALNKIQDLKNGRIQSTNSVQWAQSHDTIYVGALTPHDTLLITGNWSHTGPILVLNDGVLIFKNAIVVDSGDIWILGNGKLLADSSSLTFPQQYFYQRSLNVVGNAYVNIQHCSFDYSGVSHNLLIGDSATVIMNQVHQRDWTTCAMFGKPTLSLNGVNQAGEYILNDSSTATFTNTDTLLLWHQFPNTAVVNYAFPKGDTVYGYKFNNTISGISGIKYKVSADTCHDVMWAMMPVNGSDITISNSTIRAIGAWFQNGDTAVVSHIYNNSTYTNLVAPLSDRNLHLINSSVQTWSMYVFDKSVVSIDSSQLGEVGTEGHATIQSENFILDGSGGYFWATDTSVQFAVGVTVDSYVRSEKNGIFVFEYGWEPYSAPSSIGNSLLICVQSIIGADPVAYDASVAWFTKIDGPDTTYTTTNVPVSGSAWITWGPQGGWLSFANYSLYYQLNGASAWTKIVEDTTVQVHHNTLGIWNTQGLAAGSYLLRLVVYDTKGDSVVALKPVTVLSNLTGISQINSTTLFEIYPNPANSILTVELKMPNETSNIEVVTILGDKIYTSETSSQKTTINVSAWPAGIYFIRSGGIVQKFIKQ